MKDAGILFGALAFLGLITVALHGNVDPATARRALEAQGLTNVRLDGYSFLGCSRGETYSTSFRALGANGKPVSGVVCGGFFKNVTVRYE
ncbi:hypothetical protein [Shinella zoogloeoides]|uniref:hypothetical protein n=1 Tax=Shinella zoogloeoides TaxID=352475 RepID=UPI00273D911A|nr:hypothetical protein [Shinella zoogloeoides]WLR90898.1 hypothetical protein Q9316_00545 [Shinella zoogloeoides]